MAPFIILPLLRYKEVFIATMLRLKIYFIPLFHGRTERV